MAAQYCKFYPQLSATPQEMKSPQTSRVHGPVSATGINRTDDVVWLHFLARPDNLGKTPILVAPVGPGPFNVYFGDGIDVYGDATMWIAVTTGEDSDKAPAKPVAVSVVWR